MARNIFSLVKKRIELPSREEIVYIFKNFTKIEKIIFFIFLLIFIVSFSVILWRLNNAFSVSLPDEGGTIREGVIGTTRFLNPLLAVSDADRDMVALIYSGLMRPDNKGGLIYDLAEHYEVSENGLEYTFVLKPDLKWSDGATITSNDIIFTIQQAKDLTLKSPKRIGWEGVEVEKIDDRTVKFKLQKPYTPFLENTTLGIIPKHLWKDASSELMSFSELNIKPIGSGPFKIKNLERDPSGIINSYTLVPNPKFALGKPYIQKLVLKFYPSESKLTEAYRKGDIESISAVPPEMVNEIKKINSKIQIFSLPRVFGIFFNQNNAKAFTQKEVREALNLATDKKKLIDEVLRGLGTEINSPIPPGSFGALEKKESVYSLEKAKGLLEKKGWKPNEQGFLIKEIKKETLNLSFAISTSNVAELKKAAELIKSMWEKLGARIEIRVFEIGDLNQNIIRPRKYDALLFGEIVGRDPDPFVFWHSSQRNDPGLNIALYTNLATDKILEESRTTLDLNKRKELYQKFQEEIEKDVPAVFLYSPYFIYIVPNDLRGMEDVEYIVISSERFSQIYKWYIKTNKVWKIFAK